MADLGCFRDVFKLTVAEIAEESVRRLTLGFVLQLSPLQKIKVPPAVVIVVKAGNASAHDFGEKESSLVSGLVLEIDS